MTKRSQEAADGTLKIAEPSVAVTSWPRLPLSWQEQPSGQRAHPRISLEAQ